LEEANLIKPRSKRKTELGGVSPGEKMDGLQLAEIDCKGGLKEKRAKKKRVWFRLKS